MRSLSSSSSEGVELGCRGTLSHGAPTVQGGNSHLATIDNIRYIFVYQLISYTLRTVPAVYEVQSHYSLRLLILYNIEVHSS